MPEMRVIKPLIFTTLALIAFAANSVLCRLALGEKAIDAAGFTSVRLLSGALVLLCILIFSGDKNGSSTKGSWSAAFMLFLYAVTFSFAYLTLNTGTGALILFGSVQITMILRSLFSGNRLLSIEWMGMIVAFSGIVYLVLPGVTAPSFTGFSLMASAGIAWGLYTLKGKASANPFSDTTYNFLRSVPFVIVLGLLFFRNAHISREGIILAAISGGITSGIGYTLWYIALRGLSATQAAVVQLSVPVIAGFGGVVFISEQISLRLTLSALLTLGGILMVILSRNAKNSKSLPQ
ncbi:DMT family transporter [Thermodesulfobacteriota bacterium]